MLDNNQNPTEEGNLPKDSFNLRFNYWLLDNRDFFHRLGLVAFVVLDLFLISLVLIFYSTYFFAVQKQNKILVSLIQEDSNFKAWLEKDSPRDLVIADLTFIHSVDNRYDLAVSLENKNQTWFAKSLQYVFTWKGGKSDIKETFLLPGEQRYLLALNEQISSQPQQLKLEIINTDWQWVGDRFVAETMDKNKLEIVATNFTAGQKPILDRTTYQIKNNTIYNFWETNFNIILYQGQRIVGLNRIFIEKFYSEEERSTENVWIQQLPAVTKIVVDPEINFLNTDNYIPMTGSGELK
jgi:hypothetical protein